MQTLACMFYFWHFVELVQENICSQMHIALCKLTTKSTVCMQKRQKYGKSNFIYMSNLTVILHSHH